MSRSLIVSRETLPRRARRTSGRLSHRCTIRGMLRYTTGIDMEDVPFCPSSSRPTPSFFWESRFLPDCRFTGGGYAAASFRVYRSPRWHC